MRRLSDQPRCIDAPTNFQRGRRPATGCPSGNAGRNPRTFRPGIDPALCGSGAAKRIYGLASSTGHLARFVVFGSFVTAKEEPNDVDIVLLMEDRFDLAAVTGEAALPFQHMEADAHFGASVFWTRRSGAIGGEQAMIEYWQARREGGRRGIIEIVREAS
jgi:hypothetical protein